MTASVIDKVFSDHLRTGDASGGLSADGTVLSRSNLALDIATKLAETDADGNADEIIKLMKPLCHRFDMAVAKQQLQLIGKQQHAQDSRGREDTLHKDANLYLHKADA